MGHSSIFKLSLRDLFKGLVVAVLTSVFATAEALISNKGLILDVADGLMIGAAAVLAALGYLSKELITDENGKIGGVL